MGLQMLVKRPIAYCDLETFRDYFLCKFLFEFTGTYKEFAMFPGQPLNLLGIVNVLMTHTIVTFNGVNYDLPILSLALRGATNQELKDANDTIIGRGMKPWDFYRAFGVQAPDYVDHIDICEVLPGVRIRLKTYAGIAHCPTIQDLPIDFNKNVTPIERVGLATYCGNDLRVTQRLYKIACEKGWMPLREHITETIGIDVRSKSDAQIAEAITRARLGYRPEPIQRPSGYQFNYKVPACIQFQTQQLQDVLRVVASSPFTILHKDEETDEVDENGDKIKSGLKMHKDVKAIRVKMGNSIYKFGSGGLHSQEKGVFYETTDTHEICDDDVGSFYPRIIITQQLYPEQCGPSELVIYTETFNDRIAAKKAGRKKEADSKKIVLNGKFGKLGSKYSMFYAPEQLVQVTITGQLMLLMLIEALELNGIEVVSANTDGIVTRTRRGMEHVRKAVMADWEARTQMVLETTYYRGIYMRDVNNYFAITMDGEVKRKGLFTHAEVGSGPSSSKAPHREICADAVVAYIKDGTPIDETIYRCRDIRKFVTVRALGRGKAIRLYAEGTPWEEFEQGRLTPDMYEELGGVVRWAYRRDYHGSIRNSLTGNMVSDSTGGWPLMTLPEQFPDWIDYEYYVREARALMSTMRLS
jgi:hypothetical protein